MTKSEARHVAAILNAWADGEKIERHRHYTELTFGDERAWVDATDELLACTHLAVKDGQRLRIKPTPLTGWTTRESICTTPPPEPSMYDWVRVREVTDDE